MSLISEITDQLNLRWAWEKVRSYAGSGDAWIDELELAGFELELEANLEEIAFRFLKGRYKLSSLKPIPFPKSPDEDGSLRIRQFFYVPIKDQVAWVAVVNVIGPYIDAVMPTWSYGNRLFRSIWYETDDEGVKQRKIGRYRNSSGKIYLNFNQSWPMFRRHVFLSTIAMTSIEQELDAQDENEAAMQESLPEHQRCPFTDKLYWEEKKRLYDGNNLFWCSIDLEKFYPSLRLSVIKENIIEQLPEQYKAEAKSLLNSMLQFSLDLTGWDEKDLDSIGIPPNSKTLHHIPTGLQVAGFLANAGLLATDREVERVVGSANVAHFRYVDDHIILGYKFEDIESWVLRYSAILKEGNTGVRINPVKVEPSALAKYFDAKKSKRLKSTKLQSLYKKAEKSCQLDPRFPSPLMTKTLALVSAIARMDFNLLEDGEINALKDQLEHMLLVDIPETEIPEKTRLSFAALRLAKLTEAQLGNDLVQNEIIIKLNRLNSEIGNAPTSIEKIKKINNEILEAKDALHKHRRFLTGQSKRTLTLLRKVLRERPDRIRLWNRKVHLCRHTGAQGLRQISEDILEISSQHKLTALYLYTNFLSTLSTHVFIAAKVIINPEIAHWRRVAAKSFLEDISNLKPQPLLGGHWYSDISWQHFCFAIYCAQEVLTSYDSDDEFKSTFLPAELVAIGESGFTSSHFHSSASYAWWATRKSINNLTTKVDSTTRKLGERLGSSEQGKVFWHFFPEDIPNDVVESLLASSNHPKWEGWWFDVLKSRNIQPMSSNSSNRSVAKVLKLINHPVSKTISLYEWCSYLTIIKRKSPTDPRLSEWTALEIVKQICCKLDPQWELTEGYIEKLKKRSTSDRICIHPANFRVPSSWIQIQNPTWEQWKKTIETIQSDTNIHLIPESMRLSDVRYTPMGELSLFSGANKVRGIGLILYGLLIRSFELPALWNGSGHSDVLNYLPRLLTKQLTYSSFSLGLLLGCLQARSLENLFFDLSQRPDIEAEEDRLYDPKVFISPMEVKAAIDKCQSELEKFQISTFNHKARQLTPISIRQLTKPIWSKEFHSEGPQDND